MNKFIYIYTRYSAPLNCVMSSKRRCYPSGSEKRKRKAELEKTKASLPKLSKYFNKTDIVSKANIGSQNENSAASYSGEQLVLQQPLDTGVPTDYSSISDVSSSLTQVCEPHSCEPNLNCSQSMQSINNSNVEELNNDSLSLERSDDPLEITDDPANWVTITNELREHIIRRPINQNLNGNYEKSLRTEPTQVRYLPMSIFERKMSNGEKVTRKWLVYSPSTGNVFCIPCKLFGKEDSAFRNGFSDWKNCLIRIIAHENSVNHKNNVNGWSTMSRNSGRIDCEIVKQQEMEKKYWCNVLKRVIETIKFLAERGLAFRGNDETLGSPTNGNFLGILETIAKFDPFLSTHIERYGGKGSGNTTYLSKTICEELIQIMGQNLESKIITEVKKAKYFSISVDSTPDISHVDQLTVILRYVLPNGKPVERFVKFLELHSHGAEDMANQILKLLKNFGLDIKDCRAQSYDNAANMAGIYTGLQARIKSLNPLAYFVPCAAHSANLVGACAADCCLGAVNFFGFVQTLYNFFSASTYRWKQLKNYLKSGLIVKSLSQTRWCARADAVKALLMSYTEIKTALAELSDDNTQNQITRQEAKNLCNKMNEFDTAVMTIIWHTLLARFNATNLALQKANIDILSVVKLYDSLLNFILTTRDNYGEMEKLAKELVSTHEYVSEKSRSRVRKGMFDEQNTPDIALTPSDRFRVQTFNVIIDSMSAELRKRQTSYLKLRELFGFLTEFKTLCLADLRQQCIHLVEAYPSDLEIEFVDEFLQFSSTVNTEDGVKVVDLMNHLNNQVMVGTYPNVRIALRLYFSIPATNCEGERSFSTLSRVKNHLRSCTGQDRLNALSLMAIESKLLREIDFDSIIEDFAEKKSRRKTLNF